jgi:hypothetical protein
MPNSVIERVKELSENENYEEVVKLLMPEVVSGDRHPHTLFWLGRAFLHLNSPVVAEWCYRESLDGARKWTTLGDFGRALLEQGRYQEAYDAFKEAHDISPGSVVTCVNLSNTALMLGRAEEAIQWANEGIRCDPNEVKPYINMGHALLTIGDHERGWTEYAKGVGHFEWRKFKQFGGEPVWDGSPDLRRLAVYAEQGLGDQVLFASVFNRLEKWMNVHCEITIDCHWRLEGLFSRSFPWARVCGTQFVPEPTWGEFLDASVAMSQLMPHFIRKATDFPGERYLRPCPNRMAEYGAALDEHHAGKSGLKIGLAWTGGVVRTQGQLRSGDYAEWKALLPHPPGKHTYVNLEYRESDADDDPDLITWPLVSQSPNIDDVAALIANLDLLVGVPTTSVHLAGALGVPTICLVDPSPHCFWGRDGERLPYYDSVRLIRRTDGTWGRHLEEVRRIIEERTWPIAPSSSPLAQATSS